MKNAIPFDRDHKVKPGLLELLRPGLRRITANNPSPFTFTGTGTLVLGEGRVAVIDPGPDDESHINALLSALGDEVITHILVTHTHRDHSPGCQLLKRYTNAQTFGFNPYQPQLVEQPNKKPICSQSTMKIKSLDDSEDHSFRPDVLIRHDDVITGDDWELQCLHTPGHASNHFCFAEAATRSLFSGDHVMAWSSTVILQPDGNMRDYLQSLEMLLERDDAIYWPTHGGPVLEPQAFVKQLLAHRKLREEEIIQAVSQGIDAVNELRAVVYPDLIPQLHRGAMHSLLSTVIHLVETGQLQCAGELSFDSRLLLTDKWDN